MRAILSIVVLLSFTCSAYGQPQTATLGIPPSTLFSYVAEAQCRKAVDKRKRTCEGSTLGPESKSLRSITFRIAITDHPDGSLISITSDKVTIAQDTLMEVTDHVKTNLMFAGIGRDAPLTEQQTKAIVDWVTTHPRLPQILPSLGSYDEVENSYGSIATVSKTYGVVLTPFARVALRTISAAKEYRSLASEALTADDRAPETWIVASPYDNGNLAPLADRFSDVTTVALLPSGSQNPMLAISAVWSRKEDTRLQNAFGAAIDTRGMVVSFKTVDLVVGRDIIVVFEGHPEVRIPVTDDLLLKWRLLVPSR
jgi:hypothetical protein